MSTRLPVRTFVFAAVAVAGVIAVACSAEAQVPTPALSIPAAVPAYVDPQTGIAYHAIDRFSDSAGTVHRRSTRKDLPAPNAPVNFDTLFRGKALGPAGQVIEYYDFDAAPVKSAPVYAFVYASDPSKQVQGQKSVFDSVPGSAGYSDYWQMVQVLVPDDYVPDSARSIGDIKARGYDLRPTNVIINCPLVPYGSKADLAGPAFPGWYEGKLVSYFKFEVLQLDSVPTGNASVPYAVLKAMFAENDMSKGKAMEPATGLTHNVFDSVPGDPLYRSLWRVDQIDVKHFDEVRDWDSASKATKLGTLDVLVNCPVVKF
jgi:hypothetical protein